MALLEAEFTDLLNQHIGLIYKVCNIYCADKEDRRDLFQEIVLQLWKGYAGFKQEARFSTWMYRVALNTAISNYRRVRSRPRRVSLEDAGIDIPDPGALPTANESVKLLYQAIAQLTPVEKAMILLHLDGCTYQEMAAITGISNNNVGVKLNRIKSKLEKILAVYGNNI
ncbi:sigma-70 family RNA polymerase sigma factor [Paraflavitalea sp. CAU 1676]|uniref:RNA polymerase sigma factor n=1 Tax=Paraflavitalea sp. CAU 1676 TaxID=3032598 RepID=UPI0023D9B13C|nr:sigma-70 family RNA polymerase sigma factor [Paraflavitalea sp. CAU 1676]MDF2189920.1 sigma-70 family RNA polymerase sigma factor [Paraflavitalea sp. CAU 1676]